MKLVRQRKTSTVCYHLYGKPKKIQINIYAKQKETHKNKTDKKINQVVTKGEREDGRDKLGVWD